MNHDAVYALYSNVVTVDDGTGAFDKDGNKVEIDIDAVNTKAQELQAAAEAAEQAKAAAKQSAITKLSALGLTADEIAHLIP